MDEFAIAAAYLGRTALAGAAVLALGRAALTVARSPATRQRLAAGTLRVAALVPLLTLLPSWWFVTVPATPPAVVVETVAVESTPVPAEPPALPVEWVTVPEFVEVEAPALDEVEPAPVAVEPEPVVVVVAPPGRNWRDGVAVVAAVYAAGVAYFLGVFALGHLALVRLRRGATAAPGRVRAVWGSRRPAVLVHDVLASPVCFGVVRPAVVLPAALAKSATGQQLAWVLAHEADHLRRGDPLTGWFAGLAKALFFFAPWYWGVRRELRLAQEYLADAAALAAGGHAADYAEFLVDLTAAPVRGRRTLLAHGVRAGRSDLSRRITMVLSTTPPRAARRWATLAAVGLFAVAVALSGVTVVRADDKPKEPPAAPQPPAAPKPPQPPADVEPPEVRELRLGNVKLRLTQSSDVPVRVDVEKLAKQIEEVLAAHKTDVLANVNKLRKQIDEALAAGKTDEAKKLIDNLVKSLTPTVPTPPVPPAVASKPPLPPLPPDAPLPPGSPMLPLAPSRPAAPMLQGGTIRLTGANTDPRVTAAVEALGKALETTKDDEARAAMVQAIKLMRSMQPKFDTTFRDGSGVNVWAVGPHVYAPNFGVSVAPLPEALAEQLQLPAGTGLLVTAVQPDTPFAKAGARKNDVILKANGQSVIGGESDLTRKLLATNPGGVTVVRVLSKGKETNLDVMVPDPKPALTRSTTKKVRFETMKMEVFNGGVSIEAKKGDRQYKITGAQVGELLDNAVITVTDLKTGKATTQAGTVLSEMGEDDRVAVQTLLDQIRRQ